MDPLTTRTIHRNRGPAERGNPSSPEPVGEDTEVTLSNDWRDLIPTDPAANKNAKFINNQKVTGINLENSES